MGQDKIQRGRTRRRTGPDGTGRDMKKTELDQTGHSTAAEGQARTRATEGQDRTVGSRKGKERKMGRNETRKGQNRKAQ